MIRRFAFLSFLVMVAWLNFQAGWAVPAKDLGKAQRLLEEGEFYQARKTLSVFLKKNPEHTDAQKMMANILDQEIAWQKNLLATKAPEELNVQEATHEMRTWIERAQTYMQLRQYDQAILAAEHVFLYEPSNLEASQLIDEAKIRALKDGKHGSQVHGRIVGDEIGQRIERYEQEAEAAMQAGRWGRARLSVQKILLLVPEHPEGLKMDQIIQANLKENSR